MIISAEKLRKATLENEKELIRITNILNEKRRTLEVYGYEEEGETVEKYEKIVECIENTLSRCRRSQLLECGNYKF